MLAVITHPASPAAASVGEFGHLLVWATLDESALLVRDGEVGFAIRHSITQLDAEDRKCVGAVASRLEATLSDVPATSAEVCVRWKNAWKRRPS